MTPAVWRVAGYAITVAMTGLAALILQEGGPLWLRAMVVILFLAHVVDAVWALWRNRRSVIGE
jgi:hypothetical protein